MIVIVLPTRGLHLDVVSTFKLGQAINVWNICYFNHIHIMSTVLQFLNLEVQVKIYVHVLLVTFSLLFPPSQSHGLLFPLLVCQYALSTNWPLPVRQVPRNPPLSFSASRQEELSLIPKLYAPKSFSAFFKPCLSFLQC